MTTVDRKILMLRVDPMPDPANLRTWTINGLPLTPDEISVLAKLSVQETDDIIALIHLAREIDALTRVEGWGS
jgi:hypothetical protein